jgi:2-polyprenyl-3-methyl-5-hydroxy-6-metoxy-1,4-benzoquinol methylase
MIEKTVGTFEVTQCLLCGSDPGMHKHFETHLDEAGEVHYLLCERCGLVFQSPRFTEQELNEFYSVQYRLTVQGSAEPTEKDLRIQHARAKNLLDFLKGNTENISRCLDIGSSTGMLLKVLHAGYGCEVMGVEPGDAYREYGQREGIPAVGNLEQLDTAFEKSFDLITMAHTLEHLPEPLSYLKNLKQNWLNDSGYVLIEVPNLLGHTSFELAHLTAYTKQTLRAMLHQAGLEVIKIRAHGAPRSLLIPLYITALAVVRGPSSDSYVFQGRPGWIRVRRKIGMWWNRFATRFLTRWAWLPWPEMDG